MIDLLATPFGYLAIIVFLVLTGAGLPIPEEVFVIAAGVFSSHGVLDPWLAFAACLIGALLGDCLMYAIGYHWGHSLMREHPRFGHLLHAEREEKIEALIRQHGLKVFFLSRFLVGIRSPVYLAAGTLRIPFRRFLLADGFCATVVVGFFFWLSYAYADHITGWFKVIRNVEASATVIVVLVGAGLAFYFWRRHQRHSDESDDDEPSPPTSRNASDDAERTEPETVA